MGVKFKTQRELAKAIGVHESYVSYLLSGKRKPSLRTLTKLSAVLGLSMEETVKALNGGSESIQAWIGE